MPISSPCIRNCCLDKQDVCLGCGRTVQEVMDWGEADDKKKLQILMVSKKRMADRKAKKNNAITSSVLKLAVPPKD